MRAVPEHAHELTCTTPHSIFLARNWYRLIWGLRIVWPRAKTAWFTDGAATAQVHTLASTRVVSCLEVSTPRVLVNDS
jgi:hypothetical protein